MIWRLPSVNSIARRARETFVRFPETITVAIVCAGVSIGLVHRLKFLDEVDKWLGLLILSIPALFATAIASERYERSRQIRLMGFFLTLIFLGLFRWSVTHTSLPLFWSRYVQFSFGFHLLVAFIPFFGRGTTQGFWQYNRSLFLRFLLSVFYSVTIYGGLALALFAVKSLLDINIDEKVWFDLWIVVAFVFNTWFFLADIPRDLDALDSDLEYPSELRVFVQFILLPLVTLYFIILYAYIGKITIHLTWPKGTIGYLVSGASILGIFSLLLVHPLRESDQYRWIKSYARFFYIALFPLVVVLVMAIWRRTSEYGLTEKRYFLYVVAFHLAAMAAYFTFSKRKDIKILPISLCVLAFITSGGPWGAYSVSKNWQKARLKTILTSIGAFENGKIKIPAASRPTVMQEREMSSILDYLSGMHGIHTLNAWSSEPLERKSVRDVLEKWGFTYRTRYEYNTESDGQFYFQPSNTQMVSHPVQDVDWLLHAQLYPLGPTNQLKADTNGFSMELTPDSSDVVIRRNGVPLIALKFANLLTDLNSVDSSTRFQTPPEKMTAEFREGNVRAKTILRSVNGTKKKEKDGLWKFTITNIQLDVLLNLNP